MYNNKQVLCLILARGGSKGVPRKNIKILHGKPLIKHSIDVAKQTAYIDKIFVSTDDKKIKEISMNAGASVIDRPSELASDSAEYLQAVKHMLGSIKAKPDSMIVLLEVTLPIRKMTDVKNCIECFNSNVDCVVSVMEAKVHPGFMFRSKGDLLVRYDETINLKNRQEMEKLYAYTGSILVTNVNFLQNQDSVVFGGRMKGYLLDEKSSLDIDSPFDFDMCEFVLNSYK